jgi:hypothetical protein
MEEVVSDEIPIVGFVFTEEVQTAARLRNAILCSYLPINAECEMRASAG